MTTTKKISALPVADTLVGTESVPVVQAGATKKTTASAIAALSPPFDVAAFLAAAHVWEEPQTFHTTVAESEPWWRATVGTETLPRVRLEPWDTYDSGDPGSRLMFSDGAVDRVSFGHDGYGTLMATGVLQVYDDAAGLLAGGAHTQIAGTGLSVIADDYSSQVVLIGRADWGPFAWHGHEVFLGEQYWYMGQLVGGDFALNLGYNTGEDRIRVAPSGAVTLQGAGGTAASVVTKQRTAQTGPLSEWRSSTNALVASVGVDGSIEVDGTGRTNKPAVTRMLEVKRASASVFTVDPYGTISVDAAFDDYNNYGRLGMNARAFGLPTDPKSGGYSIQPAAFSAVELLNPAQSSDSYIGGASSSVSILGGAGTAHTGHIFGEESLITVDGGGSGGGFTIAAVYGVDTRVNLSSGVHVAEVALVRGRASVSSVGSLIDNLYGLYLPTPTLSSGGAITNRYGVYQADPAAKNVFFGETQIRRTGDVEAFSVWQTGELYPGLLVMSDLADGLYIGNGSAFPGVNIWVTGIGGGQDLSSSGGFFSERAISSDTLLQSLGDVTMLGVLKRSNVQVVGPRGAAVADATDNPSAITQLNALLARLRTHGLIAP